MSPELLTALLGALGGAGGVALVVLRIRTALGEGQTAWAKAREATEAEHERLITEGLARIAALEAAREEDQAAIAALGEQLTEANAKLDAIAQAIEKIAPTHREAIEQEAAAILAKPKRTRRKPVEALRDAA